jgi:signal transduction histidine kinase
MDNPVPFDVNALSTSLAGKAAFANATYDGEPVRVYSRPILRAGHVEGAVQFARELTDLDILWAAQLRALAAVLPLAILAAAGAAFLLTGRTLRPVAQLTETADEIGRSGDLARRLEVTGDDEIAELARTFNDMLGRLDRSFQDLQEAFDKLGVAYEQQRRFAADASHELRTPLTRLRLATSAALAANSGPEEMRRALATADRAAEAMTNLVGQLLTLARADAGQLVVDRSAVDLRVIVAEGLDEIVGDRRVETCFAPTEVIVSADPEQLRRVVVNLVGNALRHSPATGSVTVKTGIENGEALLSVADTGEGIAPEHLPHLGERFYRVDAARNRKDGGAGLGLAICKNIVHAHGGRLTFASQVGVGTTVSVALPLFSEKKSSDPHSK